MSHWKKPLVPFCLALAIVPAHSLTSHAAGCVDYSELPALLATEHDVGAANDIAVAGDHAYLAGPYGAEGALWIVDMYRYIIEHPQFLTPEGREELEEHYRAGHEYGRIYRIYPTGKKPRPVPRLDTLTIPQLVAELDSPNGTLFADILIPGPSNFNDADGRSLYISDFLIVDPDLAYSDPEAVIAILEAALMWRC